MSQDKEFNSSDNSSTIKNLFRQNESSSENASNGSPEPGGTSGKSPKNEKKQGGFLGKMRSLVDSMKQSPDAEDDDDLQDGQPEKKMGLIKRLKLENYEDDAEEKPEEKPQTKTRIEKKAADEVPQPPVKSFAPEEEKQTTPDNAVPDEEPEESVRIYVRKKKQGINGYTRPSRNVNRVPASERIKQSGSERPPRTVSSVSRRDDITSASAMPDTLLTPEYPSDIAEPEDIFSVSGMTKESGAKKTQNPAEIDNEPAKKAPVPENIPDEKSNVIFSAPPEQDNVIFSGESHEQSSANLIYTSVKKNEPPVPKAPPSKPVNRTAQKELPAFDIFEEFAREQKNNAEKQTKTEKPAQEKTEEKPKAEPQPAVISSDEEKTKPEKTVPAVSEQKKTVPDNKKDSSPESPAKDGAKIIPWSMTQKAAKTPQNTIYNSSDDTEARSKPENAKDLSEGYVNTVSYHQSSVEPLIVMAGKFSKTLRSEYESARVFRLTGSPVPSSKRSSAKKPPVNNPAKPDEKRSERHASKTYHEPFVSKFDQQKSGIQPETIGLQKKPAGNTVIISKNGIKDVPAAQTNQKTAAEPPKAVPQQKPDEPQILKDVIKTGKAADDSFKPPMPKPEKKKRSSLKSEKHKAAKAEKGKKKIRISYLFNTEEDYDPDDDANRITETKPQLDDYNEESDAETISTEISTNFQSVFARTIVLLATSAASLTLAILAQCTSLFTETIRNGWLWFALIGFVFFALSAFVSRSPILNGLSPLKRFKGNSDTAVAVASVAAAMQSFSAMFTPDIYITGKLHVYTALVTLALLFNSIGKLLIITRTHYNFSFLTKPYPKYAGKIYTDTANAEKMSAELPTRRPIIAYTKHSKFMSNFLQLSYAPDPSEELASRLAPWTSIFSVICGIVYGVLTMSFLGGLSSFALTAFMSVPLISLIAVNLPLRRLCKNTLKGGAMISSYETVKQFSDTNAVMIDSSQLYPKGSVTLSGMKSFKQSKLNEALLSGAAIMYAVNGTMIHIFENIVQCSKDMLPKVESVIYEDGKGLVGWVNSQRVLIGNRELLKSHNIEPPEKEVEDKYYAIGNDITYISVSGELIAMFILSYKTNKNVAIQLKKLEDDGVSFVVRTVDANLTREMVAKNFGLFYRCITILPTSLGNICHEVTTSTEERTRAYLVTRGKLSSFARAVSGCIRIKTNATISVILQCVALAIGLAIVTLISFVSGFEKLGCFEILIYSGICTVIELAASLIKK